VFALQFQAIVLDIGASNLDAIKKREELLHKAYSYATTKSFVPYIWGGSSIGDKSACDACKRCVVEIKPKLENRRTKCAPCSLCGIDCSHFVHQLFRSVGLPSLYATSRELLSQTKQVLRRKYFYQDLEKDLSLAMVGDILVFPKHVVVLTEINGDRVSFIHATRFKPGDVQNLGGIRLSKDIDVVKYRGGLRRILRHVDLDFSVQDLLDEAS
jgi:hypothetical protein